MIAPTASALHPAGIQSQRIAELFSVYCYIAGVVFVVVLTALAIGIARKRHPDEGEKRELSFAASMSRFRAVSIATGLTCLTLVAMLLLSVMTSRAMASLRTPDAIRVNVTGHKWWWEFTYPSGTAGTQFTTAYEMHIPVGRPVQVDLTSADVIHSFWVPSLNGKRDAFPGKHLSIFIRADQPGRYEGQCAEFCGAQHANMRLVVVAESEAEFNAWMAHSLEPAPVPEDPLALRGREVFLKSRCVTCHAIGGTDAFATVGPNLTHVASRREIAMGTVPNTRGHLAGWIVDPQSTKPGVIMPSTPLAPDDLNALLTYLTSLR
jgi:cytochrome c oxidase subunit 2